MYMGKIKAPRASHPNLKCIFHGAPAKSSMASSEFNVYARKKSPGIKAAAKRLSQKEAVRLVLSSSVCVATIKFMVSWM
jgi:hypothetical protein